MKFKKVSKHKFDEFIESFVLNYLTPLFALLAIAAVLWLIFVAIF